MPSSLETRYAIVLDDETPVWLLVDTDWVVAGAIYLAIEAGDHNIIWFQFDKLPRETSITVRDENSRRVALWKI